MVQAALCQSITADHHLIGRLGIMPLLSRDDLIPLNVPQRLIVPDETDTHGVIRLGALNDTTVAACPHTFHTIVVQ